MSRKIFVDIWSKKRYNSFCQIDMQKWRNWQTRRLQVPVAAMSCGFKSHLLHLQSRKIGIRFSGSYFFLHPFYFTAASASRNCRFHLQCRNFSRQLIQTPFPAKNRYWQETYSRTSRFTSSFPVFADTSSASASPFTTAA